MKWRDVPSSNSIKLLIQQQLDLILPSLYGYSLINLGELSSAFNYDKSNIVNHLVLSSHSGADAFSDLLYLPLASDDIDAIFAPFVLEESTNPHQLLREIVRSLRPGGKLILVTFNPLSSWLIHKLIFQYSKIQPWCFPLYRRGRIAEWFSLLGLDISLEHRLFAKLPGKEIPQSSSHIITSDYSRFGAINLFIAEKKIKTLTPIRNKWEKTKLIKPDIIGTTRKTL